MDIEYIKKNYKFETLNKNHDLSDFKLESAELNDFLKNDALNQQNEKLNLTKLVICDDEIVGFVRLLTDGIKLRNIKNEKTKTKIKEKLEINDKKLVPAIKIGRFTINKKYSKKKV